MAPCGGARRYGRSEPGWSARAVIDFIIEA